MGSAQKENLGRERKETQGRHERGKDKGKKIESNRTNRGEKPLTRERSKRISDDYDRKKRLLRQRSEEIMPSQRSRGVVTIPHPSKKGGKKATASKVAVKSSEEGKNGQHGGSVGVLERTPWQKSQFPIRIYPKGSEDDMGREENGREGKNQAKKKRKGVYDGRRKGGGTLRKKLLIESEKKHPRLVKSQTVSTCGGKEREFAKRKGE